MVHCSLFLFLCLALQHPGFRMPQLRASLFPFRTPNLSSAPLPLMLTSPIGNAFSSCFSAQSMRWNCHKSLHSTGHAQAQCRKCSKWTLLHLPKPVTSLTCFPHQTAVCFTQPQVRRDPGCALAVRKWPHHRHCVRFRRRRDPHSAHL